LHLGVFLFNVFQCTPISHFWEQWHGDSEGYCVGPEIVSLSGAIFDMLWTLVILAVPMPYVFRLNLPWHKKFAVAVMFAWGILYVSGAGCCPPWAQSVRQTPTEDNTDCVYSTVAIMCYRYKTIEQYDANDNPTGEFLLPSLIGN
jgi:hypothetical protein